MPRVLWGLLGSMPRSWKHRRHDSQALRFPALRASSSSFPVHLGWWGTGSPSSTRSNCWARSLGAGEPGWILSLCTMKHWLFLRACFKSSLLWELSVSVLHEGVECLSPLAPTWGITRRVTQRTSWLPDRGLHWGCTAGTRGNILLRAAVGNALDWSRCITYDSWHWNHGYIRNISVPEGSLHVGVQCL